MSPTLFDNPIVHANDPETSRLAARRVVKTGARNKQAAKVLELVTKYADATAVELMECSCDELDEYQVRRRLTDLEQAGLIVKSGARLCRSRGSKMTTWKVFDGTSPSACG